MSSIALVLLIIAMFLCLLEITRRVEHNLRIRETEQRQREFEYVKQLGDDFMLLAPQIHNKKIEKITSDTLVNEFKYTKQEAFLAFYSFLAIHKDMDYYQPWIQITLDSGVYDYRCSDFDVPISIINGKGFILNTDDLKIKCDITNSRVFLKLN